MDLQTLRLAIAAWEKGVSRRAQGWAGENGDRNKRAIHPSQVAATPPIHIHMGKNKEPALKAVLVWDTARLGALRVGG